MRHVLYFFRDDLSISGDCFMERHVTSPIMHRSRSPSWHILGKKAYLMNHLNIFYADRDEGEQAEKDLCQDP